MKSAISLLMEVQSVGAMLVHANGWNDMMELICTFHDYANVPKICNFHTKHSPTGSQLSPLHTQMISIKKAGSMVVHYYHSTVIANTDWANTDFACTPTFISNHLCYFLTYP
jgi:hypothetical protein